MSIKATYEKFVGSTRIRANQAVRKGLVEQAYSGGSSSGLFQEADSLTHEQQQYNAALRGWQFAAIKVVSITCALQELRVGIQRQRRRSEKEWKKAKYDFRNCPLDTKVISEMIDMVQTHPIIDLLENPNRFPEGLKFHLKFNTVFSLNAVGKAYWFIQNDDTTPTGYSVYYLPSTWVFPLLSEATGVQIGWGIKPPWRDKTLQVPFEDIVPFVIPDPSHPGHALSYLQTQSPAVNTDDKIQSANYRAMEQGIYPGLALHVAPVKDPINGNEYVPQLTVDQRKELTETVMMAAAGAMKFGMPFIVDGMINKITPVTNKPAEMDFRGGAQDQKARICLAYGVNPIVMGEIENANRASSFVAHEGFYRTVVNPTLGCMGETLTKYLAPRFGNNKRLYVWFDQAQPRDADLLLRQVELLSANKQIRGNEMREAFGMAPDPECEGFVEGPQGEMKGVGRPPST